MTNINISQARSALLNYSVDEFIATFDALEKFYFELEHAFEMQVLKRHCKDLKKLFGHAKSRFTDEGDTVLTASEQNLSQIERLRDWHSDAIEKIDAESVEEMLIISNVKRASLIGVLRDITKDTFQNSLKLELSHITAELQLNHDNVGNTLKRQMMAGEVIE